MVDLENDETFERFVMWYETAQASFDENQGPEYLDKWKAEFHWSILDYIKRKRIEISTTEHRICTTECFTEACGDKECKIKRYCHHAKRKDMGMHQYVQMWREAEDQKLRNLIKERRRQQEYNYTTNLDERLNRYEEKYTTRMEKPSGTLGFPFSIPTLNEWTDGWCPGRAYCFAARTGQGKSALALQEARYAWANSNVNVLFMNCEMPIHELEERLDSARTGVSFDKILKAKWDSKTELEAFRQKLRIDNENRTNEFIILDTPHLTLGAMSYNIRQYYNRWGKNFIVIVDNLNRMAYPHGPTHDAANSIAVEFHSLVKEFDIPGLMLCQLNRDAEGQARILPKHFRDADKIPDNLDAVFAILMYGVNKKKLVVVKGRSFSGNHVILQNNLSYMTLNEMPKISNESPEAFDEDDFCFISPGGNNE